MRNVLAIHRIGYLGTHKGTDPHHVVRYIDWDQHMNLQGLVNRPVRMRGQPIRIKQTDKIKHYLKTLIPKLVHQKIQQQIIDLAQSVILHGWIIINKRNYSKAYL